MFVNQKIRINFLKQLIYLAASFLFIACSTVTTITSYPPNAVVSIGDSVIGSTPIKINDFRPNGAEIQLKLELENYQTILDTIAKNDNKELTLNDAYGVFLIFPMFWSNSYHKNYLYYLLPTNVDSIYSTDSIAKKQLLEDLLKNKVITKKQYQILIK